MENETQLNQWLHNTKEDPDLAVELTKLQGNEAALYDRFYSVLSFGTGGLRGIIGAGTNRMNIYTIAQATQGLAQYLKQAGLPQKVAIAYDSRIKSDLFALQAARVLAANGITALLYPELAPTPALSFAVRHHSCGAGICITASHNPSKYNGYKVYGPDGCQITDEAARAISNEIQTVDIFKGVKNISREEGFSSGLISHIPQETVESFLQSVFSLRLDKNKTGSSLKVVYTPLNGTGLFYVTHTLKKLGIKNLSTVSEQRDPDGNFPTCPYPNPEIPEALHLGLAVCQREKADLLLATDPDCDRVGVAVKRGEEYSILTGNEIGVLLLEYVCRKRRENGTMPQNPIAIKTIVTTEMAAEVAKAYGVELINVLTGFKYIGEKISKLEKTGDANRFIFGFEESCGYLSGTHVRDKDGVNAALLICDMADDYHSQGITLVEAMENLYREYGYYLSHLDSYSFEGARGMKKMQALMATLRKEPAKHMAGRATIRIADYLWTDSISAPLQGLPSSDVLQYQLEGDVTLTIRPSGTEPKLKVYYSIKGNSPRDTADILISLQGFINNLVQKQ